MDLKLLKTIKKREEIINELDELMEDKEENKHI